MKIQLAALGATLAVAAVAIGATVAVHDPTAVHLGQKPAPSATSAGQPIPRPLPSHVTGVVSNNLAAFDAACGCRPDLAVHYARWGDIPDSSRKLVTAMSATGAAPMLEISPFRTSLSDITSGKTDRWIRSYASMVRSLKTPVFLSFAPEANGNWYSWGWQRVQPSAEVAAWRHVVSVFRQAGAGNARWVWIVNQEWRGSGPLPKLWPGASYVDEVGIDGYFKTATDTFGSVFAPTIKDIRALAPGKPMLITETGAAPRAGKKRALTELTAGVRQYQLNGFVWFDIDQGATGSSHADWSLEHAPDALAAYRSDCAATAPAKKKPAP